MSVSFSPVANEISDWFGEGESTGSRSRPSTSHSSASHATFLSAQSQAQSTTSAAAAAHGEALPTAAQLVESTLPGLLSDNEEAQTSACMHIALLLDSASDEEAVSISDVLRNGPGLGRCVALLESGVARIHQTCLLILANVATTELDVHGDVSRALRDLGALQRMLPHLEGPTLLTVVYALGAIRNTLSSIDDVEVMRSRGAVARLRALSEGETALSAEDVSGKLRQYATGCLINIRQLEGHSPDE